MLKKSKMFILIISLIVLNVAGCSKNQNIEEIESVINKYNANLEKSYMGEEVTNSKEIFLNDEILEKANWRNKFINLIYSDEVSKYKNNIEYKDIKINENLAKVITEAKVTIENKDLKDTESYTRHEAYLLEKIDGKWKIHSIFEGDIAPNKEKGYQDFIKENDLKKYGEMNSNYYLGDEKSKNVYKDKYEIWMKKIKK